MGHDVYFCACFCVVFTSLNTNETSKVSTKSAPHVEPRKPKPSGKLGCIIECPIFLCHREWMLYQGLVGSLSHSAKHRKMADFDHSGNQNPGTDLMKLGMVDYILDRTSHDNFDGVAQRGWFRCISDLSIFPFCSYLLLSPSPISKISGWTYGVPCLS